MPDARYKTCPRCIYPERSRRIRATAGLTLVEMVIAIALMVIIFAAILPQFRVILNSWDSKAGAAETLQNGRILIDHLNRNLSKAVRITAVSASSVTNGYIQFIANDSNTYRYDIGESNYVEYGPVGSLADLAGPVSSLQFTCYDGNDFTNAITDVNSIRFVDVQTTLTNSSEMGQDKTFTASAYLRTNARSLGCWQDEDIGDVGATGSAAFSTDTLTIEGSGLDIWDYTDEFHYVYQSLSGNGQIVARVVSMTNTNSWAKAGVMIRETLTGDSKHAMMVVTPGNGNAFQRRTSTGGISDHTAGSSVVAPYWVKLKRVGNVFSGYESSNGSIWTQVGSSVTITMATNVYIGLAVTSHNDGVLCTADFNNISFLTYEGDLGEGFRFPNGASVTISKPSGTTTGDLLVAAVATDGDTSTSLTPPGGGWNSINVDDYIGQVTLGAWWKIADASEPVNYTFTWIGSEQAYGWMMRFTGHDPATPIHTSAASGTTSGTPTSPEVTTTIGCCLILRLGAFDDDDVNTLPEPGNPGLPGHSPITMDKSASPLLQDGFETDLSKWTTDWDRTTAQAYSGSYSVYCGSTQNYLTSGNINTLGYSTIRIEFWYMDDDIDDNDNVYIQLYNGTAYANRFELGNTSPEDTWHQCVITINNSGGDAQYFRANFRIRINGTSIDINENLWIDDVTVTASGGNTVSGGAGYVRQALAGSSGTSTFSLSSSNEARMLTIAIAPDDSKGDACCGIEVLP